jgi:BirA family biotin operon repressor/biotin-[acetyl-CoA-carboxylase] ligase
MTSDVLLPLDGDELRRKLVAPVGPYAALDITPVTGSTNADLAASHGLPDRTVLLAEEQTAGQGRRARTWLSPPRTGLYFSVLLRPAGVPVERLSWLTLLAGVSLVRAARALGVAAQVKWPNDILVGDGKVAGVLAEVVAGPEPVVVVGVGVNVLPLGLAVPPGAGGLPATSLAESGAPGVDRTSFAVSLLEQFAQLDEAWRAAGGDPRTSGLLEAYRSVCGTLSRDVHVELPGGATLSGIAADIDTDGRLLVELPDGSIRSVSAGDVVHVRNH